MENLDVDAAVATAREHPDVASARGWPPAAPGEPVLLLVTPHVFATAAAVRGFVQDRLPGSTAPVVAVVGAGTAWDGRPGLDDLARIGAEVSQFSPASTATEAELCGLWREVLGTVGLGVRDHFLDVGGESLSAVELVSAIEERFGITIVLEDVFDLGTVEELARRIDACRTSSPQRGDEANSA